MSTFQNSPALTITIATRESRLALWQAHHIADRLLALGQPTEIRIIKTSGFQPQ